jgi:uncharacterized membrane protein YqhA
MSQNKYNPIKSGIELLIFQSKWLLIPFYIILILALGVYTYFDIHEFVEYIGDLKHINKDGAMKPPRKQQKNYLPVTG